MKTKYFKLVKPVFLLLALALSSTILLAQSRPLSVNLDTNNDDDNLCGFNGAGNGGKLAVSQFCRLYKDYKENENGNDEGLKKAKKARNEMINLVRGQIDSYYKFRKADRRTKVRWFQSVLDFLEIGGATAIAIMNGERAKTVVGAAIAGLQGGRTAFNKNFEILQTQTLINKMNARRDKILIDIVGKMDKPVTAEKYLESYSWYAAKNDLRDFLIAGTFDNALDALVKETGEEAVRAERRLSIVEKGLIVGGVGEGLLQSSRDAEKILKKLQTELANDTTRESATNVLRAIVTALIQEDEEEISTALREQNITASSEGEAITKALRKIKGKFVRQGEDSFADLINKIIVDQSNSEN